MSPTIPKTMKAVQLVKFYEKYEVREVPVPEFGENDLLVKVGAAGFCHTDYQVWEGVYESKLPQVPSHEPVGTVVAIGSRAEASGLWKIGDRVGVMLFNCNNCVGCRTTSDVRFCKNVKIEGLTADGGMAQYLNADNTVHLPDGVAFEEGAPLLCAGATTWGALKASGVSGPAPIGVLGIGGLGMYAVQFAKALGHRVVAIDNREEGRALAKEVQLPADFVVDFNDPEAVSKIKSWSGRDGLAAVIGCTDNIAGMEWTLKILRPQGILVPVGLPVEGFKFSAFILNFQEMTIKGSLVATRNQVEDMMEVVAKHGVKGHITTVSMKDAPKLPEMYLNKHLKGRLVLKVE